MNGYPEGLKHFDYFEYARQFLTAYDDLPERPPPKSWPRYFTLCHAIELALKGYLVALDPARRNIFNEPLRHDLNLLMNEAISGGLSLSAETQASINDLQQAHKKFWHRYPTDLVAFTAIEQFAPAARELLRAALPSPLSQSSPSPE
jgi:hypothetical protein